MVVIHWNLKAKKVCNLKEHIVELKQTGKQSRKKPYLHQVAFHYEEKRRGEEQI